MNARLDAGLPAAASVPASSPELRAWVIVHPLADGGYRVTRIELRADLVDLDVDSSMLTREDSVVVETKDALEKKLAELAIASGDLVDPRDCACPI